MVFSELAGCAGRTLKKLKRKKEEERGKERKKEERRGRERKREEETEGERRKAKGPSF